MRALIRRVSSARDSLLCGVFAPKTRYGAVRLFDIGNGGSQGFCFGVASLATSDTPDVLLCCSNDGIVSHEPSQSPPQPVPILASDAGLGNLATKCWYCTTTMGRRIAATTKCRAMRGMTDYHCG